MIEILLTAVYSLTSLLLWPVVLILLFAVMHCMYLIGELIVEARERRGTTRAILDLNAIPGDMTKRHGIREWSDLRGSDPDAAPWLIMDRAEAQLAKRLDRARLWVRQNTYAATKAAVLSLSRSLNQELRLAGEDDIKVGTIMPWAVDTPWWRYAANYTGHAPRMAMMDDPQIVIDAIVKACIHPDEE